MDTGFPVFKDTNLLNIPPKRAGWSDRTALFMAEMSKIAYHQFELNQDGEVMTQGELDEMLGRLLAPLDDTGTATEPDGEETALVPYIPGDAERLKEDLARAGFEIVGLFSDKGTDTQAFLAKSVSDSNSNVRPFGEEEVAILSFRGTKTIKDWITNAKGFLKIVDDAQVHAGFQKAFDSVEPSIREKLDPLLKENRTLYLTGHSLGGALAMFAAREIAPESHGACYTFGSPRVARFGFARAIKTPIYRVVNSNDVVSRLPPAYVPTIVIFVLRILNVPAFGILKRFIGKFTKYVHHGDMRFLRRTKNQNHSDLQVVSNPDVVYRFIWYGRGLWASWRSPIDNHDINVYCEKLAVYAKSRN